MGTVLLEAAGQAVRLIIQFLNHIGNPVLRRLTHVFKPFIQKLRDCAFGHSRFLGDILNR
ncbi:hypothetical protein D3C80_2144780 [compost metagenome]